MGQKMTVDALMLDLDGTILDSAAIYYNIVAQVLDKLELPQVSRRVLRKAAESGEFDWATVFPEQVHGDLGELTGKARELVEHIAPRMFAKDNKLVPGAADVLARAAGQGLTLAIVTSTPGKHLALKLKPLESSNIHHLFSEIITTDDTARKKPDAEPLVLCCNRLGIAPGKSVYVGDTWLDIRAGKAAGTQTIGVLTGFDDYESLEKEAPDVILESIARLPEAIWM
jgi:HAD superfamily hydrolase (TIGR01549 family)